MSLEHLMRELRALPPMTPEQRYAQRRAWVLGESLIRARDRKNGGRGWWVEGTVDLDADEVAKVEARVDQALRAVYPNARVPGLQAPVGK